MGHLLILETTACGCYIYNLQTRFSTSLLQFYQNTIQPISMGLLHCKTGEFLSQCSYCHLLQKIARSNITQEATFQRVLYTLPQPMTVYK